jgi:hypothetical protein
MENKTILIKYGIIGGLILGSSFFIFHAIFGTNIEDMQMSMYRGYAIMILALSTVFFGVRAYRDKFRNGFISFKDAFVNGLIVVLIASIFYVIGWEIYYPNFLPDFADIYLAQQKEAIEASGIGAEAAQQQISSMETMMEKYKNPLFRIPMSFLEIFPVGLIISLITAFILKRKSSAEV